jgi:hypothetical protein
MMARAADAPPIELIAPEPYPVLQALRRNGREISVAAGVVVAGSMFLSSKKTPLALLQAVGLGALVAVGIRNLSELDDIIAETLLPQ